HRQMMPARSQHVGCDIPWLEFRPRYRPEPAQMVVHRACQPPREGQQKRMLWRAEVAPFEVFEVQRPLVVHQVGVGTLHPRRLPDTMEVNGDMMPRRRL